tara:strand:+ start:877 stop:1215 length:339 start_codon:yes stop_codon:yes gene_type:complete
MEQAKQNTKMATALVAELERLRVENSNLKDSLEDAQQWQMDYEDETGDTIMALENEVDDLKKEIKTITESKVKNAPMGGRWSGKMEAMTKKASLAPTTEEGWNRLRKFLEEE